MNTIQIEVVNPFTVMEEVVNATQGMKYVTVELINNHFEHTRMIKMINKTWKKEYKHYLDENCVILETLTLVK